MAWQAEDKLCKDFFNTIPLISLLRSKAMRPRHWLMLMSATGSLVLIFMNPAALDESRLPVLQRMLPSHQTLCAIDFHHCLRPD